MRFISTKLHGAYLVELELLQDERGFFARSFCPQEFRKHGLDFSIEQTSVAYNHKKGTLRGLHYQIKPFEEIKLVRCMHGAIYDVIVDLNEDSPTHMQWQGFELSEKNRQALYVPKGFAHGFQTLRDGCELLYYISHVYVKEAARGIRWDDPAFKIQWPEEPNRILSANDKAWPNYSPLCV